MSHSSLALHNSPALGLVALSAASLLVGYQFGKFYGAITTQVKENAYDGEPRDSTKDVNVENDDDDDEGGEDIADGDLSAIKPGLFEPCKMVLVVRTDLKMTPGKIAAQCGHATLACYKALIKTNPKLVSHWERTGQAKIALKGNSEDQLLELEAIAKSLNLCARSIHDAGHTQVDAGTRTVLGIGPAPVKLINEVTGQLRLL